MSLAPGQLTIAEASALITLIDRMLRLAERMWKFQQASMEAAAAKPEAPVADVPAPRATEKPAAPLYSPVNSQAERSDAASGRPGEDAPAGATSQEETPLARAA